MLVLSFLEILIFFRVLTQMQTISLISKLKGILCNKLSPQNRLLDGQVDTIFTLLSKMNLVQVSVVTSTPVTPLQVTYGLIFGKANTHNRKHCIFWYYYYFKGILTTSKYKNALKEKFADHCIFWGNVIKYTF